MKRAREEVKKGAWHLGSAVNNVLNMRHKSRWHAFGSEHAQIGTVVRLQQLPQQTQQLITTRLAKGYPVLLAHQVVAGAKPDPPGSASRFRAPRDPELILLGTGDMGPPGTGC